MTLQGCLIKKFKKLLNSKDVTICAWCYSERSNDIIKAVR